MPTDDEVKALLAHAKGGMGDIIAVYHATGARTHELIEAHVSDYQPQRPARWFLADKRSRTLRNPSPDDHAQRRRLRHPRRRARGHPADAYIFPNRKGKPYTAS